MAEAEDVIVDAARHATVFVRSLWQRRSRQSAPAIGVLTLDAVAARLDLLVSAALGTRLLLRPAQAPARRTLLRALFARRSGPSMQEPVPATDGATLWLPASLPTNSRPSAADRYRVLALHQAMRALRGSARYVDIGQDAFKRDVFTVLEALGAEDALRRLLPGLSADLDRVRAAALAARPPLDRFDASGRCVEGWVRAVLGAGCPELMLPATPGQCWEVADGVARRLRSQWPQARDWRVHKDLWIGDLRRPGDVATTTVAAFDPVAEFAPPPRSARMTRRPQVRRPQPDEDDRKQGAWMIQTTQPHEHAEDGFGMQRPTDRDETTAAEDFADALSELPEARLVTTPGRPKEVLLSDDPPPARARAAPRVERSPACLAYPEWDWQSSTYRHPGAIVHVRECALGPQRWVSDTLKAHAGVLRDVRRRFELLRAERVTLRRRAEGDEIDIAACVDARADFKAGLPLNDSVYLQRRVLRRDTAVVLLVDASGSTDAWIDAGKRIIDVEKEALLLVSAALDHADERYAVLSFSGEGPGAVVIQEIKTFAERGGPAVGRRISALEPQHYTRAGAALRHASTVLMREPARHRLLLLLSDGKPNDIDAYEGRYGVEDTRQAVVEAKLQGIFPFCLTIDRQAASYLPRVFGANQYALLSRPQRLPGVLLDWMQRLLAAG